MSGARDAFAKTPSDALECMEGLTGILSLEVANEAYVLLHPLKGSQLHGVVDDFHRVLQHLGEEVTPG